MSNEHLPGWMNASITDFAEVFLGKTPAKKEYSDEGTYKVIKFRDLKDGIVDFHTSKQGFVKANAALQKTLRELHKGDVLITSAAHSGENIGKKCAYVSSLPAEFKQVYFTGELLNIRCKNEVTGKWVYYFFRSVDGFKEIQEAVAGVHLTGGRARNMVLPLAPIAEQQRIVSKLEQIFEKVNASQLRLTKIPPLLKRFRQSVLAAAFSGRLTADWRGANQSVTPAEELVRSFVTPVPEPYLDIFEKTVRNDLPTTWAWVPFGQFGKIVGGGTPAKDRPDFWNGPISWVSPKDMKRDRISDSEDHITELALQHSSVKQIPIGSVLVVVRGMILNHTVPVAITDRPVTLNQDMKALIPERPEMSEYLFWATKYIAPSVLFEVKEATHGTRRIETALLKNWAVPLAPIAEQKEIVRRVRVMFALANQIESRYREGHKRVESISQSILGKAFRGELVPAEAELAKVEGRSFESAEELLLRVKGAFANRDEMQRTKRNGSKSRVRRTAAGT